MRDTVRADRQQPPAAEGQGPAAAGLAGRPAWARSLLRRCWPPALIILAGLGLWELIVRFAHVPG